MASKRVPVFRFHWIPLLLTVGHLKHASSKPLDPQNLVCLSDDSLTLIDTDGTKHLLPAQDWQDSLNHTPCYSHLSCDAAANGIHVPTSEGPVYAVPGHNAVFVVTLDSTETRLLLTVDLRAKSCSFSKLIAYPPGFLVECMRNSSTQPIWLIPVQHSSGEWMEKEPLRVDVADDGKAVNRGVSAVMEANNGQWYFYARQDLLCYMDLERGPAGCLPVVQGKCHHMVKILPVRVREHTGVLLACTGGEGKQRMDYVALYETGSANVTKSNYPTGQFKAIHVSSSGDFTAFMGATYITVVRTLDSSSSARQREVSVPGDVEFSIVCGEVLLYTASEAAPEDLLSYKTYALDLPKAFEEGTLAKLLEGDNCTVTQQLALGEWIVTCSEAMFWYRGNISDRVHILWLDGTAREQQCFTSLARAEPVTEHTATTSLTLPPNCSSPLPCETEQFNTVAIVTLALALVVAAVVIVTLIVIIMFLYCKLRNLEAKARDAPMELEPDPAVANPEDRESWDSHSLLRNDNVPSVDSPDLHHQSLPPPNGLPRMSLTSLDGVPCNSSQPQSNGGAYQPTHAGTLFGGPNVTSTSTSSTASNASENRTSTSAVESDEDELLSAEPDFAESGAIITSEQGVAGKSEPTVRPSSSTRTPGSGCAQQ